MRDLIVGDLHVKKTNLEESKKLWLWILHKAKGRCCKVVLLGDIFNDFGVVHIEVYDFWIWAIEETSKAGVEVAVVAGNHDMSPDGKFNFPAFLRRPFFRIYDKPTREGHVAYIPFIRDNEQFLAAVNEVMSPELEFIYCHQEFNGCQFENGFYAPHGVDPDRLPYGDYQVISGHIHMRQTFGRIFYPGTPRALTKSDANEEKFVFALTDDALEAIKVPVDVAEPIKIYKVFDKNSMTEALEEIKNSPTSKLYVDIVGSKEFVAECLKKNWRSAKVKTDVQSAPVETDVAESKGIKSAFSSYFMDYISTHNLGKKEAEVLWSMIHDECKEVFI